VLRKDQWVASGGVSSSVRRIVSAIASSPIRRGAPRARRVVETLEPMLREPAPPRADRRRVRAQARGDLFVLEASAAASTI
jgi:hypothetical protein